MVMEKMQIELQTLTASLKKQSDDSNMALQAINESLKAFATANVKLSDNLQGLNKWVPAIDALMLAVTKSIEEVGARVAALEADRLQLDDTTPQADGHRVHIEAQGNVTSAFRGLAPALAKGTRQFRNSPVTFDGQ